MLLVAEVILATRSRYHSTSRPTTSAQLLLRQPRELLAQQTAAARNETARRVLKYSSHSIQPTPRRPRQHAEGRRVGHDREVGRAGHLGEAHAAAARERREGARVGGIERRGGDVDVVAAGQRGEERRHRHRLGARVPHADRPRRDARTAACPSPPGRLSSSACRFWSSVQSAVLVDERCGFDHALLFSGRTQVLVEARCDVGGEQLVDLHAAPAELLLVEIGDERLERRPAAFD